jgi:hypothetical protein
MGLSFAERREAVRVLGLPPNVDDLTLGYELQKARASAAGRQLLAAADAAVAAAERRACAEDTRIVLAAVDDGRIPVTRVEFWCEALQRDRDRNRAVLAALSPDGMAPRRVEAAAPADAVRERAILDSLGLPIAQVPDPVRIRRGVPPEQWTQQQHSDYFMHKLGTRFSGGGSVKPPPQDVWYQPSPDDLSEFVETADGQGYWREKDFRHEARRVD